jgi:drug/metabolite transporter (DMT)-like permease
MQMQTARLHLKTRVFTAVVVISNVLGNFSLSWGVRRVGGLLRLSPLAYIEALVNPWVALGVSLLILWMFSHLTLLSWADLSYVLPVTSIGYALTAVLGRVFLHEQVSWARWTGVLFIMLGVGLVARTAARGAPGRATGGAR